MTCNPNWTPHTRGSFFELDEDWTVGEFRYYNIGGLQEHNLSMQERCAVVQQHSFDVMWMADMDAYLSRLSKTQVYVLKAYTHHGDRLINTWLRSQSAEPGKDLNAVQLARQYDEFPFSKLGRQLIKEIGDSALTTEGVEHAVRNDKVTTEYLRFDWDWPDFNKFFTDQFIEAVIAIAAGMLSAMIQDAPRLDKDVLLFRGITRSLFDASPTLVTRGFMSTSTSGAIAAGFASPQPEEGAQPSRGFLMRLHVPRGTQCLPVFFNSNYEESEVILAPGTRLRLLKACQEEAPLVICDVGVGMPYAYSDQPERLTGVKRKTM